MRAAGPRASGVGRHAPRREHPGDGPDGGRWQDGGMDVQDQPQPSSADEPVEEWPPRAWRETTRSAGHKQAM